LVHEARMLGVIDTVKARRKARGLRRTTWRPLVTVPISFCAQPTADAIRS
jgi:hypothetical protein